MHVPNEDMPFEYAQGKVCVLFIAKSENYHEIFVKSFAKSISTYLFVRARRKDKEKEYFIKTECQLQMFQEEL